MDNLTGRIRWMISSKCIAHDKMSQSSNHSSLLSQKAVHRVKSSEDEVLSSSVLHVPFVVCTASSWSRAYPLVNHSAISSDLLVMQFVDLYLHRSGDVRPPIAPINLSLVRLSPPRYPVAPSDEFGRGHGRLLVVHRLPVSAKTQGISCADGLLHNRRRMHL